MNNSQLYALAAPSMRPGDIIAFHGTELISDAIDDFTHSPISHIATVRQGVHDGAGVIITESTIADGVSGPQSHSLGEVLAGEYPHGRAWWLREAESVRARVDWQKFYAFIGEAEGSIHYDIAGLFGFLERALPVLGPHLCQHENPREMFCDAYALAILEACGVAEAAINWREQTPQDFLDMPFFGGCVQIWGAPTAIRYSLAA
jgi:hypothetical protein